jgi:chromosome segregation ATPase
MEMRTTKEERGAFRFIATHDSLGLIHEAGVEPVNIRRIDLTDLLDDIDELEQERDTAIARAEKAERVTGVIDEARLCVIRQLEKAEGEVERLRAEIDPLAEMALELMHRDEITLEEEPKEPKTDEEIDSALRNAGHDPELVGRETATFVRVLIERGKLTDDVEQLRSEVKELRAERARAEKAEGEGERWKAAVMKYAQGKTVEAHWPGRVALYNGDLPALEKALGIAPATKKDGEKKE